MAIIDIRAQIGSTPIWGAPYTDKHIMKSMERHGVEKALVSSTLAGTCDYLRGNAQLNQMIAGKAELAGVVTVNVNYVQDGIKEFRRYMNNPEYAAIFITSGNPERHVTLTESQDLLNAYRRYIKPVFLEPATREGVFAAQEIAKAFPGIKFVLLGMGGEAWRNAAAAASKTLNLVLETSGSLSPDKIKYAAEMIGAHRMVFGSNLPFTDPAITIGLVEDSDLSDEDKKMIFRGSARRLFAPPRTIEPAFDE